MAELHNIVILSQQGVDAKMIGEADKDVVAVHCLLAHRNHELTNDVANGKLSAIFPQAHNRLRAQKSISTRLFDVA